MLTKVEIEFITPDEIRYYEKNMLVFCGNIDTQGPRYYIVEYNKDVVKEVVSDIRYVIEMAEKKELPEKEGNLKKITHYKK